ncbi:hypothetical protein [Streptomyces sp. NPDC046712]|uniref:hypothetical protein n=1 Tax=Streptomyces sp. NPDC046712 TaxID=3154802 RepID=UPI003407F2DE
MRRLRRALLAVPAAIGLTLALPSSAWAATGSASNYMWAGHASATWTWSGPGRLTNIDLHVEDDNCNSNPVYAQLRVTRSNGGVWYTSTHRYDYNGCSGSGTNHNDLTLSDGYNIKYIALYVCNDGTFNDCIVGPNSSANPLA